MRRCALLRPEQLERWERDGFVVLPQFAESDVLGAMLERTTELAREAAAGHAIAPAYVVAEERIDPPPDRPELGVSKLFRVHREEAVFREFCREPALLDRVESLIGPRLDCFLSQFIFKHPGALGQPWHQDAFYFPFDRRPQIGAWLAVTEARLDNGPLWVLPGSHREAIHDVVPDRRVGANGAYVEIVDHDFGAAVPVLLQPGDLLLFHSHLMHRSTNNESTGMRAAMVYHYGETGTVDRSRERFGFLPANVDWMTVRGETP